MCQAIRFRQVKNPFTAQQQILQLLKSHFYMQFYHFWPVRNKYLIAQNPSLYRIHARYKREEEERNINSFGISYLEATFLSKTSLHFLLCSMHYGEKPFLEGFFQPAQIMCIQLS